MGSSMGTSTPPLACLFPAVPIMAVVGLISISLESEKKERSFQYTTFLTQFFLLTAYHSLLRPRMAEPQNMRIVDF